ncbi:sodium:solute symporter family protein [Tissierella pigra]|uniref:Sodium:solute symporter family protein n=1 Tax=Tissierella pigra TaxID=2607614 RepID=A0A6N7XET6_9FIRM|nr:sodium:solute symporter family protein [Tissierella pigra]MSU00591.1 sodium:solute symporter family protein [Tissierella pigra]
MNIIDIILIIAYLIFMLYLGFYASKKQNNMEDFYLGGKKTGTISMMCLWLSSWVGGAAVIATAANAYELGITAVWYVGAMCVGFAIFGLTFTKLIKKVGDKFSHITYPDLIEDRYNSRCRMVSIITTILANIAYNAGQLVAAGGILYTFTGWNITFCIILSAVIVSIYTATGGLLAVTYTDVAQTTLILGSLVIVIPFIYNASGSIAGFQAQMPPTFFKLGAWGTSTILGFIVSITLTFFTSMDSYTRCFAAKDEKTARNGTLLAIIGTAFIAIVSTYIGMAGRIIFPNIGDTSAILATIVSEVLPTGVKGIMLIGIISALMSTSDISTLTASANITRDIYQRYINPEASEKHLLKLGTISSMLIGALSTIMAIKMMDIVNILYLAFTINSAGLFLPTIGIFFWEKANSKSAFWSMTLSLITVVLWFLGNSFNLGSVFNIDPLWPGLLVSALVFIPMSLITKPSEIDKEKIEKYLSHNKIN